MPCHQVHMIFQTDSLSLFQYGKASEDWPGMRVLLQLTSQPVTICDVCRKHVLANGENLAFCIKHGNRLRNKLFDSQPLVIQPFCVQDKQSPTVAAALAIHSATSDIM